MACLAWKLCFNMRLVLLALRTYLFLIHAGSLFRALEEKQDIKQLFYMETKANTDTI